MDPTVALFQSLIDLQLLTTMYYVNKMMKLPGLLCDGGKKKSVSSPVHNGSLRIFCRTNENRRTLIVVVYVVSFPFPLLQPPLQATMEYPS